MIMIIACCKWQRIIIETEVQTSAVILH